MRKRDKRVEIYFNEDELNKLDKDRKDVGMTRTEYIRLLIIGNVINKKNNEEILNIILELYSVKEYLRRINNEIDSKKPFNSFTETIIKLSIEDLNKVIKKLNDKLD